MYTVSVIIVTFGLDVVLLAHGLMVDEHQNHIASPPPVKKPMLWVHLPKAGGTLMCQMANRNGEHVAKGQNCNWNQKDASHFMGGSGGVLPVSCAARAEYFHGAKATWGQIEREINDEDLCFEDFEYGVLLRHPLEYAQSLLNCFAGVINSESIDINMQCVKDKGNGPSCKHVKQFDGPRKPHMFFDNYITRALGGLDVWNLPAGAVSSHHVDRVLERLDKFAIVMLWADIQNSTFLDDAFGWKPPDGKVNPSSYSLTFTESQKTMFGSLNPHDFRIWDHFKNIASKERVKRSHK
jgi:hypothetical protein